MEPTASTLLFAAGMAALVSLVAVLVSRRDPYGSSLERVLAMHEESQRAARAQNDKLTSKIMALVDPSMYLSYRQGAYTGIPEGSVPPAFAPGNLAPQRPNGGPSEDDQIEEALKRLQSKMEGHRGYEGPVRVDTTMDYESPET